MTDPIDLKSWELIHREIDAQLEQVSTSADRIDTKANVLISIVVASVPAGLWDEFGWHLVPALALAVLSAAAALFTSRVTRQDRAPRPSKLAEHYGAKSYEQTLSALIGTKVLVHEANWKAFRSKVVTWNLAAGLLILASVAAATGLALH